jgi:hypothetical protein
MRANWWREEKQFYILFFSCNQSWREAADIGKWGRDVFLEEDDILSNRMQEKFLVSLRKKNENFP